jgi:carbonic anhydrase
MREITELVEGYREFLSETWPRQAALYRTLAEVGQSPRTMIVACCDSRADPATIFNAKPGALFVVRNVANLVPPCAPHGNYHGTSAALEFAVSELGVENIVVLGHARCGGIAAFIDELHRRDDEHLFVAPWLSILNGASAEALHADADAQQEAMEHAGIRLSIENLASFPFVKERLNAGRLSLHGAYFDIATGVLQALDAEGGAFEPVT